MLVYVVEVGSEAVGVFDDEGLAQKYADYRNGSVRKMEMKHTSPTGRGWVVECSKTEVIKCERIDGDTVMPWGAEVEMFRRRVFTGESWYFTVFAPDSYTAKQEAMERRKFLLEEGLWV